MIFIPQQLLIFQARKVKWSENVPVEKLLNYRDEKKIMILDAPLAARLTATILNAAQKK